MVQYITANAGILETIGIFFPFLLSAILKTAQGSSTVALQQPQALLHRSWAYSAWYTDAYHPYRYGNRRRRYGSIAR